MNKKSASLAPLRACLLIGGRSSRMGRPKHLITGENGLTWVENTVNLLLPYTKDIVLSGAGKVPAGLGYLERLADLPDVHGPLTGIVAAMRRYPDCCWLLLACDMPNVTGEALDWLLATRKNGSRGTVPRLADDGFVEPLLALYEPAAGEYFEELCRLKLFRISQVAGHSDIATPVVPGALAGAWSNINTPDELSRSLQSS